MVQRLFAHIDNVRLKESIFTLPFAYLGMVLGTRGVPSWHQVVWVTLAMAGARTFAMGMNRLVDLELDRRHPRARLRPLPAGRLSVREVGIACAAAITLMFVAAWQLNPLCVALAPLATAVFTGYSYVKRASWLTHVVLGLALGGAPVGGWIAVTGQLSWPAVLLGVAVMSWATGFDILYACGDADEDRKLGVHTIPVHFGLGPAMAISAAVHVVTILLFGGLGVLLGLGWPYWAGLVVAAGLLAYQHSLVTPQDLTRLNAAFFNVNGMVSVLVAASSFAGLYT